MKELLEKFIKSHRQYRGYNLKYYNIVDKSFAKGKGSAPLFRFYETEKVIIINMGLFNDSDRRKLKTFCEENGMESWEWKYAKLPKHCYDWPKALLPIEIS